MELSCRLSHLSVGMCVGLSVWKVYCGKTADWIQMPYGMMSGVGRGWMYYTGVHVPQWEEAVSGGFSPTGFNGVFV